MPSARTRQREIEREQRRRRLRRQREVVALVAIAALGACFGILFRAGSGSPSSTPPAKEPVTTSSGRQAPAAILPAGVRELTARLQRMIEARSRLEERAALDFFAKRGGPLYCGGSEGRYVALTFDDGPGLYTTKVLQILKQAHAKATFFLIGREVSPWAGRARAEVASADALGIHTWSHKALTKLRRPQAIAQIRRAGSAIFQATSERPALLRPPYGDRNARVDRIARRLGLVEVLWSIDSGDSQGKNWRGIAREVLKNVQPGSIILMHDNRGQTVRALKYLILPGLKKRGYIPVTIPELLVLDPPPLHGPRLRCWQHWHPY